MEISRSRKGISVRQAVIILLALATAVVHFTLAMASTDMTTTVMFTLNFLGYIAMVAAYFLPLPFLRRYHGLVRVAFIGYTLLTIALWVVMGMRTPIGYADKAVEVLLVVLLLTDRR